jgi:hypothetical protein
MNSRPQIVELADLTRATALEGFNHPFAYTQEAA